MIRLTKYGILLFCGLMIIACSKNNTEGNVKLPKMKDAELVQALDTLSGLEYSSFYSKISTKYSDSSLNVSFKTSLRIRADSATIMTISYARIPFVNALITTDSVQVSNKKDKCYIKESINFIKEKFGVEFSLKNTRARDKQSVFFQMSPIIKDGENRFKIKQRTPGISIPTPQLNNTFWKLNQSFLLTLETNEFEDTFDHSFS